MCYLESDIYPRHSYLLQSSKRPKKTETTLKKPLPFMADEQKPKKSHDARKDRVRLTLLVYRKQGMSLDEFQQYWKNQHSEVFTSIAIVKKNLLNYEQVREACISQSRSIASQGLTSCPMFLQAHVNGEVGTLRPDPVPVYARI